MVHDRAMAAVRLQGSKRGAEAQSNHPYLAICIISSLNDTRRQGAFWEKSLKFIGWDATQGIFHSNVECVLKLAHPLAVTFIIPCQVFHAMFTT